MKPKNFPGRKYQRQHAAANRASFLSSEVAPVSAVEVAVPDSIRAIRTKKFRGNQRA